MLSKDIYSSSRRKRFRKNSCQKRQASTHKCAVMSGFQICGRRPGPGPGHLESGHGGFASHESPALPKSTLKYCRGVCRGFLLLLLTPSVGSGEEEASQPSGSHKQLQGRMLRKRGLSERPFPRLSRAIDASSSSRMNGKVRGSQAISNIGEDSGLLQGRRHYLTEPNYVFSAAASRRRRQGTSCTTRFVQLLQFVADKAIPCRRGNTGFFSTSR